jgi:hypothetical protein
MARKPEQLELQVRPRFKHGGRRPGAGRPKSGRPVGVPHRARPFHDKSEPERVTWKVVPGLPSLREPALADAIGRTVRGITKSHARRRTSFRITHIGIEPGHLQLIVEAGSKPTLMRGLRGLGVWIARRVNEALGRTGQVLADRYEARSLTTPRELRSAMVDVVGAG